MGTHIAIGACLLIGSAMLLYVARTLYETLIFMRAAARTTGTVVRLDHSQNSDGNRMYLPVFEYRANDGAVYQHISTVASKPPAYQVGETAVLLYHKRNPRQARIRSFTELWMLQAFLLLFGIICIFSGLYMLLASK